MKRPRRFGAEMLSRSPGASRERDAASDLAAVTDDDEESRARDAKPLIVVAEDDASMRELIASSLRKNGHDVVEATDGADLVEQLGSLWLAARIPSLIIMDVRMPRCSGLDFLAGLRKPECAIPVIVITAFGDRALHREARALGALAVLDKPFRMSALREVVSGALKAVKP